MNAHLQNVYHESQIALQFVGIGTILCRWLSKRRQQHDEDGVVDTLLHVKDDGPWQSADSVFGEMYLKVALKDAPGFIPRRVTGWRAFKHRLRVSPYRVRHAFRRTFLLPSRKKIDRVMRGMWKNGRLVRADFDHTDIDYYKLRN